MSKKKITKRERNQIIGILLAISSYSFLFSPTQSIIQKLNLSDFWLLVIGILFLWGVYKLFDLT